MSVARAVRRKPAPNPFDDDEDEGAVDEAPDPARYGCGAAEPADASHLERVAGFQDDDGPAFERPAGVKARFKYAPGGKAAAFGS